MTLLYIQFSLNSFKCYSNILDKFNVWGGKNINLFFCEGSCNVVSFMFSLTLTVQEKSSGRHYGACCKATVSRKLCEIRRTSKKYFQLFWELKLCDVSALQRANFLHSCWLCSLKFGDLFDLAWSVWSNLCIYVF